MKILCKNLSRIFLLLSLVILPLSCTDDQDSTDLATTLYVRHKGADLPAHIYGNSSEKIFLITLHGGPGGQGLGFRNTMFQEQIEKDYAVVYFDQRGAGMSQGHFDEEDLTIDLIAEDVLALVKVIKANYGEDSRFFLLGHSYGGTVGTAVLLKDQEEFLGWIEVGGSNHPHGVYFANIDFHSQVADEQIALGNSVAYWESVKALVNSVDPVTRTWEDFAKLNSEAGAAQRQLRRDGIINRASSDADIFNDYNLLTFFWNVFNIQDIERRFFRDINYTDQLSDITIPTLLLWGKYDMVVPPSFGETALQELGSSSKELIIFERSGHSPQETELDAFAAAVLNFMEEHK